jgi:hypothetical protein
MFLLLQMPTDPPTSFYALSWIVMGALATALIYVFRQWQRERKNCTDKYMETIDRLIKALDDADDEH